MLFPNVFRNQNDSDNRKQICVAYLLLVLHVQSWHSRELQKIIFYSSSYLKWKINIICSEWKKLALHYIIPLLVKIIGYSVVLESNVYKQQCVYRAICLQSNVSTQQCVYRAICLQSNVSAQQCFYRKMCPHSNISTQQCVYTAIYLHSIVSTLFLTKLAWSCGWLKVPSSWVPT